MRGAGCPGAFTATAASESGEQVQGNPLNAWTTDPVFTNLTPGRTHYAFARVTGLPGLDPVVCEEPLAVEIAADGQGGDGEQGQGGNDSGDQGGDQGQGGDNQGQDGDQGGNGSGNDGSGDQDNGNGQDQDDNGSGNDGDQDGNQSGDDQDSDGEGSAQNDQDDNRTPDDNHSNDSSEALPTTGDASTAGPLSAIVLGAGSLLAGAIRRLRRP